MNEGGTERQDGGQRPGDGSTSGGAPPPSPRDKQAALDPDRAALGDRLLRLAAEFENWKKRSARERTEAEQRAREDVLRDVVAVADGLERALASMTPESDAQSVRSGIELLLRNLLHRLEGRGVRPIVAVGDRFDPRRHDAVARSPSRDVEPGTVVDEVQRGYLIDDRLLRPSSVIVAETAEPPAREPSS